MKCNCISEIETKMADHFRAKAGETTTAKLKNIAWSLGLDVSTDINIPFYIKGTEKGFTSAKGKEVIFVATYCPFCGVKTK